MINGDDWITDKLPKEGERVQVVATDRKGTYPLPFPCYVAAGGWRNGRHDTPITVRIIAWRKP